jgi:hypothetical protein
VAELEEVARALENHLGLRRKPKEHRANDQVRVADRRGRRDPRSGGDQR